MDFADLWTPLRLSLQVALWSTGLNLILGTATGWWLARSRWPGRNLLDSLLTLPMVLPPTVLGYCLLTLVGREGTLGPALDRMGIELVFTVWGAVLAATIASFPLVFRPARAAFEGLDRQLEGAAWVLGLGRAATFFRVILPLAWRAVLSGLLLAFARSLGEFGATLMIAGSIPGETQTLSIAIYEAVQAGQSGAAAWLVAVTSAVCIGTLLLAHYLSPPRPPGRVK